MDIEKNEDVRAARRWLNRAWRQEREINSLLRLKAETRDRLLHITASPDAERVKGGGDLHRFDRLVELESSIDNLIDAQLATKAEILDMIAQLDDGRYRSVLLCRYTRFLTWERIAVELHYGYRQIHRLHAAALRDIAPHIREKMS